MIYQNRLVVLSRRHRDLQNGDSRTFQETLSLQIVGGSRGLIEQLLGDAQQLACPRAPGVSIMTSRYESWETTSWQPRRPVRSLVLADGVLEDVLADMRGILRVAGVVHRAGVPYRRGYLLHGPPGNGKTTLVLAAAGELELSVAVLSLSSRLMSDDACGVGRRPAARDGAPDRGRRLRLQDRADDQRQTGVTLSGLLNALDGVSSREGRICS